MKRSAQFLALNMLMAGMFAAGSLPAQAASAAAGSDDLRAAVATTQDITEGKRVADASCARCHGMDGIGSAKGVPHIAGQRPAYIHLELKVYQTKILAGFISRCTIPLAWAASRASAI